MPPVDVVPSYLQTRGLVRQHLDSFDYFVNEDLGQIIKSDEYIRCEADPNFYMRYTGIRVGKPSVQEQLTTQTVTPMECRLRDLTYAAPIYVDVEYTRGNAIVRRPNVLIGRLPIMLRSQKCVLHTLTTEDEFARVCECPLDSGGYFVVNGAEKVIMAQEQMVNNRIIIDLDKAGAVRAFVTSFTHQRISKTNMVQKKSRLFVQHNSFTEDIPVCVLFRAMGATSDQEIIQLVGLDHLDLLSLSIEMAQTLGITSTDDALRYLGTRLRQSSYSSAKNTSKQELALEACSKLILGHIPVVDYDLMDKAVYLGIMARRVLAAIKDLSLIDDKDYYGNKRIQLAGDLLSLLFEDLFKSFNFFLRKEANQVLSKTHRASQFDILRYIKTESITLGLNNAIGSGNWTLKRFRMDRAGVSQPVTRLSYLAALGTMTKIASQFEKSRKVSGPRALQPSQFGMLCPSDTPEGESCGLQKNFALLTHVTTHTPTAPIERLVFALGVEPLRSIASAPAFSGACFHIFLNGHLIGLHASPHRFVQAFKRRRRSGHVGEFVSIYTHEQQRAVYISSDVGRVCRPLLLVDKSRLLLTEEYIDKVKEGQWAFADLVKRGIAEYVDVNEENDALIAVYPKDIISDTTHMEIDPFTILGVCAGMIPFPHHNQSPRNTYQSIMGKQAIGAVALNQFRRLDTVLYLLCYPQRPLVQTRTIELVGLHRLPAGHNAMVAVMSYSGYDIEDALILNKASLDRGFGRCMVMRTSKCSLKKYADGRSDQIMSPGDHRHHRHLGDDGIVQPGAVVEKSDMLIHKEMPEGEDGFVPCPVRFKGPCTSVIDQVLLTSTPTQHILAKVNVRSTRRPEIGDKFSSRHGQKGVCGLIVEQQDLPFTESGVCPDVIMNPHGFPSRMTVGKMIELIAGKAGLFEGAIKDGTAFAGEDVGEVGRSLVAHGYSYTGKDVLTCGMTGELMEAYIFMGPVYYQKLKHMVLDKIHARATGPRSSLTRQPTEGRSNDGGLRLGEMERDCLIGYGSSLLLQERLMLSSDAYTVWVCDSCGLLGYEHKDGSLWCTHCSSRDNLVSITMPYPTKLLLQELVAMSILPRLRLR